ncbi:hypothetical protein JHK85_025456 [Glycine max]|nr:hypothetical protein JHK87_024785 [Glycine soja]KAG5006914.1 hypothetical protein JHK85_025456 [Glycine max]
MTPIIIISGRKVGKTLQDMGTGQDLVVQRRESMALNFEGLVLVCTWINDLQFVLQSTPPSRWPRIEDKYKKVYNNSLTLLN